MGPTELFQIAVFAFVAATVWSVAALLGRGRDERLRRRLSARDEPPPPGERAACSRLIALLGKVAAALAAPFMPASRETQAALRRQLGYAGIYSPSAIRAVAAGKFACLVGGLLLGYAIGALLDNILLGLSLGGLAGYAAPALWMRRRIRTQRKSLELGLPDALDLLVVCVEAGLTLDAAFQRVAQELALAHPALARELDITHMETRVGLSRAEALKNLGARTGCDPLRALATMLVQAERFGTSIAASLRVHAESLRVSRQHAAEEMAAKASVKLSFPVVLFIFPALLIVLAGPAAIGLLKSALFAN